MHFAIQKLQSMRFNSEVREYSDWHELCVLVIKDVTIMVRSLILSILLIAVFSFPAAGDGFLRTYAADGQDYFEGILILPDNAGFACQRWAFPSTVYGFYLFDNSGNITSYLEDIWGECYCLDSDSTIVFVYEDDMHLGMFWMDLTGTIIDSVVYDQVTINWIEIARITKTSDGGYFISVYNDYNSGTYLWKIDSNHDYEWHMLLEGIQICAITEAIDQSLLAAGVNEYGSDSDYLVNVSSDGSVLWEKEYPVAWDYWGYGIKGILSVPSGIIMVSSNSIIYGTDAAGDIVWTYQPSNNVDYYDITVGSDGKAVACGMVFSEDLSVLTKIDTDGQLVWEREYPLCGLATVNTTEDGGYIISGAYPIIDDVELLDALLVRTDSEGWWGPEGIEPDAGGSLLKATVHPNPSCNETFLRLDISESASVGISVYDVTGRLALERPEMEYQPGSHEILLDGFSKGVYLCRVSSWGSEVIQRFVVLE